MQAFSCSEKKPPLAHSRNTPAQPEACTMSSQDPSENVLALPAVHCDHCHSTCWLCGWWCHVTSWWYCRWRHCSDAWLLCWPVVVLVSRESCMAPVLTSWYVGFLSHPVVLSSPLGFSEGVTLPPGIPESVTPPPGCTQGMSLPLGITKGVIVPAGPTEGITLPLGLTEGIVPHILPPVEVIAPLKQCQPACGSGVQCLLLVPVEVLRESCHKVGSRIQNPGFSCTVV